MNTESIGLSGTDLIKKLKEDLPREVFQPRTRRGFLIFLFLGFIISGTWVILRAPIPWYAALPLSLLVGMTYGSMAFLAHETLHGSTFKSKWAQDFVGYCGFFIYFITPTLWRVWHNKVHHVLTNVPDLDPDSYGTLERFNKIPLARFQFKTGIGSGSWLSAFFYLYRFSYHAQIVLWVLSKKYAKEFKRLNRPRAITETLLIASFWLAFAIWAGPQGALFAVVVPMMVANFIIMSYISTNHFLRPLSEVDEPVDNSMSVTVSKFIDLIHLQFSHHVEHHYFPTMNPHYAPLIRNQLRKWVGDRYLAPSYWKAIVWLYRTPRIYEDGHTLINPYTGRRVKIEDVEHELRGGSDDHSHQMHPHAGFPVAT